MATGEGNTIDIILDISGATEATCLVDWDGLVTNATEYQNEQTAHKISNVYGSFGYYDIHLVCVGPVTFDSILEEKLYVGVEVTNVKVANVSSDLVIPVDKTSLGREIDVTLQLVIEKGLNLTIEAAVINGSGTPVVLENQVSGFKHIILPYTWFVSGSYLLQITVSNPFKTLILNEIISVQEAIRVADVVFKDYPLSPYYIMAYHGSYLDVYITAGDGVFLSLKAYNQNNEIIFMSLERCEITANPHELLFNINATGEALLLLDVYNHVSKKSFNFSVVSFYQVNGISLSATQKILLMNEALVLNVETSYSALLPIGDTNCTINYNTTFTDFITFTPVSGSSVRKSQQLMASSYNITVVCSNLLPTTVNGETTTLTFSIELIVENSVDSLTFGWGTTNIDRIPWSKPFHLFVENTYPLTDLPLANITCLVTFKETDIILSGPVDSNSSLVFIHQFSNGDADYTVTGSCYNLKSQKISPHLLFMLFLTAGVHQTSSINPIRQHQIL